ncbi:sodium- and chloride-dependent neutral and basic amino acid transporter B(0+) isoform X1 [Onthophagus taurus]|uniref:sodium- and chloride-dependent neutral and basic amino acid transporter B(0+) isoform X1 n=1 Tax=Onthophagus taurus TaxID=166361 RepID=UPI0039BE0FB7
MFKSFGKEENLGVIDGIKGHQRIIMYPEYRPKLLTKVPHVQKAIDHYNSVSTIDDDFRAYENYTFVNDNNGGGGINGGGEHYESNVSTMSSTKPLNGGATGTITSNILPPLSADFYRTDDIYDYSTIKSSEGKSGSYADVSPRASNSKLAVRPKLKDKCTTCLGYIETGLCIISLACGLGNIFYLPQGVLLNGGLPFLIAYLILAVLVGLPLLTLEIGLGQIVQEGFTKTWRAVPFFRGVAYIKVMIGCLLTLSYFIYTGLSVYYIVWYTQGAPPFKECRVLRMDDKDGYETIGISGQECIKDKTFLKNPFDDPKWYGIFVAILFCLFLITTIWLLKRTRSYAISLQIYLLLTFGCLIALVVKAAQFEAVPGIIDFGTNIDWSVLTNADVWYHAAIQVFLSTNIGFGVFVTNAGIILKKVNPIWTAFGYILINMIIGVAVVLLIYAYNINQEINSSDIIQIHLLTLIYNKTQNSDTEMAWSLIAYFLIAFSGLISVTALLYTIYKAISLETRKRWLTVTLISGLIGFILCCLILLSPQLNILHLFDHYIIGNLILIIVVIDILSMMSFYGCQRLQSDFEFIVGNKIPNFFIGLWWICPFLLLGILIWSLSTLNLNGYTLLNGETLIDPIWLYATGWSIVLLSIIFIIAIGIFHASRQDEYYSNLDKFKASFKFSTKWGPTDPIMLYNYVQWHSKAKDGERDFTLRRRGTRDYTHSVKNRSKYDVKKYVSNTSDSSMNTDSIAFRKSDQNQNNLSLMNLKNFGESKPSRITSLVDVLEPNPINNTAQRSSLGNRNDDGGQSEGYGTFRNGPYIIGSDEAGHVCHRKDNKSYFEEATVL